MVPAHRVGGHAEALLQHGARVVVAQPPLADVAGPVHHQGVRLVRHLEVGRVEADREILPVGSGHGDLGLAGLGVQLQVQAGQGGVHGQLAGEGVPLPAPALHLGWLALVSTC